MIDLDSAIRAALDADAERAPIAAADWVAPNYPIAGSVRPSRRGLLVATAAAVAMGLVAAMVAFQRADSDTAPTLRWRPDGVEVPLRDYGEPDRVMYPTVAGLTRSIGIEGMASVALQTALSYRLGRTAEVERCVIRGNGAGCGPVATERPRISPGTSPGEPPRDGAVWIWSNVPVGTAIVTFRDGTREYWQRPNSGVVIFPLREGLDEFAIAHDADGTELERADFHAPSVADPALAAKERTTPNSEQYTELTNLTYTAMETCLTQAGATWTAGRGIAHFPSAMDEAVVWDTCVDMTKQTIAQRVQEMGLQFEIPPK